MRRRYRHERRSDSNLFVDLNLLVADLGPGDGQEFRHDRLGRKPQDFQRSYLSLQRPVQ